MTNYDVLAALQPSDNRIAMRQSVCDDFMKSIQGVQPSAKLDAMWATAYNNKAKFFERSNPLGYAAVSRRNSGNTSVKDEILERDLTLSKLIPDPGDAAILPFTSKNFDYNMRDAHRVLLDWLNTNDIDILTENACSPYVGNTGAIEAKVRFIYPQIANDDDLTYPYDTWPTENRTKAQAYIDKLAEIGNFSLLKKPYQSYSSYDQFRGLFLDRISLEEAKSTPTGCYIGGTHGHSQRNLIIVINGFSKQDKVVKLFHDSHNETNTTNRGFLNMLCDSRLSNVTSFNGGEALSADEHQVLDKKLTVLALDLLLYLPVSAEKLNRHNTEKPQLALTLSSFGHESWRWKSNYSNDSLIGMIKTFMSNEANVYSSNFEFWDGLFIQQYRGRGIEPDRMIEIKGEDVIFKVPFLKQVHNSFSGRLERTDLCWIETPVLRVGKT